MKFSIDWPRGGYVKVEPEGKSSLLQISSFELTLTPLYPFNIVVFVWGEWMHPGLLVSATVLIGRASGHPSNP